MFSLFTERNNLESLLNSLKDDLKYTILTLNRVVVEMPTRI